MRTIGIAGLSKDAGKTSIVNDYLSRIPSARIGVSTLGIYRPAATHYKPMLSIPSGCFFTTIPDLLRSTRGLVRVISHPAISTALGPLFIYQSLAPISIRLAGPATSCQLNRLCRFFESISLDYLILDTSLDRKSVLNIDHLDEMILAAGAACSPHLESILDQCRFWADLSRLPASPFPIPSSINHPVLLDHTGSIIHTYSFPLLGHELDLFAQLSDYQGNYLYLPAGLGQSSLSRILPFWKKWNGSLILKTAFHLQLDPESWSKIHHEGLIIHLRHPLNLREIAINSYSPLHSIDCRRMRTAFRQTFPDLTITDISDPFPEASSAT
ncbi:MAG: hypothetical protein KBA26_14925 [Candidatus Delongbacteria bacterium]|nr:hypothetical protein [Candidatus Delongbacteria bacterium]